MQAKTPFHALLLKTGSMLHITRQQHTLHSGLQTNAGTRRRGQTRGIPLSRSLQRIHALAALGHPVRRLPEAPDMMTFNDRRRLSTLYIVAGLILTLSGHAGATELNEGTLEGIYPERHEIVIDDGSARIGSGAIVHLSKHRRGTLADLRPGARVRFSFSASPEKPGGMPRISEIWVLGKSAPPSRE